MMSSHLIKSSLGVLYSSNIKIFGPGTLAKASPLLEKVWVKTDRFDATILPSVLPFNPHVSHLSSGPILKTDSPDNTSINSKIDDLVHWRNPHNVGAITEPPPSANILNRCRQISLYPTKIGGSSLIFSLTFLASKTSKVLFPSNPPPVAQTTLASDRIASSRSSILSSGVPAIKSNV